ncbi:MAG: hypothetical protein EA349_07055 [Halomonadaceae bacterium]|nr:MAG: hypothetical protein EA349_07055 [Halomonadaceae bacterium]
MNDAQDTPPQGPDVTKVVANFDAALEKMTLASSFAKITHLNRVLDLGRKLLSLPEGPALLYARAHRFDDSGIFAGSDWAQMESLKASFVPFTFQGDDARLITLECMSELRMLAVANGMYFHPGMSAEQAQHFLTQVLAFNLQVLFGISDEGTREQSPGIRQMLDQHLSFVAEHIGFESILDHVVGEVWRIQRQRPIQVDNVRQMVYRIAACLFDPNIQISASARGAERLVSALYGPTQASQEDPGVAVYHDRLTGMDDMALDSEAQGLARAMHDTGLVSAYHAVFLRYALDQDIELVVKALGLSSTGRDSLLCYRGLMMDLAKHCIQVETCQSIYGMSQLLERGILYQPSIAAALWRQMQTPLHSDVRSLLSSLYGTQHEPGVYLMAGIISVLGQPLGLGQGNNPACQSTRAMSMWAYNDPDYLLQLVRWASRDNQLIMLFEGESLNSAYLGQGMISEYAFDLDPLSLVLVPHLDRIYMEMGRRSAGRGEDAHRWINPEFHGWWVNRGFAIAVDIHTGKLQDVEGFVRTFYALYNPLYNGNTPVVHPQPAGVAVTDSQARFIGWHAISILRVALDQDDVMRVYFYNPNNDSGQDWGNGVVVSTEGHGEQHGESSLPVEQFTSRLYIFHYDVTDWQLHTIEVPEEEIDQVKQLMHESWAQARI